MVNNGYNMVNDHELAGKPTRVNNGELQLQWLFELVVEQ